MTNKPKVYRGDAGKMPFVHIPRYAMAFFVPTNEHAEQLQEFLNKYRDKIIEDCERDLKAELSKAEGRAQ